VTAEELQRKFNSKLAVWGDRTCTDVTDLIRRGVMNLPPGTSEIPDLVKAQLRVVIGFALREAALAGMQLQVRKADLAADRAVLREDQPLVGVTATARRVVSDLRPTEHVTQRFAPVVAPAPPPAVAKENPRWDEEPTVKMVRKPVPDLGDE
jgi:hypothetical protein